MSREERGELGRKGRMHVEKNYSMENYAKKWDEILSGVHERHGSWESRKNYQSWECMEMSQ